MGRPSMPADSDVAWDSAGADFSTASARSRNDDDVRFQNLSVGKTKNLLSDFAFPGSRAPDALGMNLEKSTMGLDHQNLSAGAFWRRRSERSIFDRTGFAARYGGFAANALSKVVVSVREKSTFFGNDDRLQRSNCTFLYSVGRIVTISWSGC